MIFFISCITSEANKEDSFVAQEESCQTCFLTDDNNFRYQGSLDIASVPVRAYENIRIDWSQLSQSIQGQYVDATQVQEALLLVFPRLRPSEIMEAFANDTLEQSEIGLYMRCESNTAQCLLDDFGLLGSYPGLSEHFTAQEGSWLIVLQHEEILGAVSLVFIEPDIQNTSTEVQFKNDSASLSAEVNIQSASSLHVDKNTPWRVNWSQLQRTGQDNPLDIHRINRLELGRYDKSIQELEEQFFYLPDLALESQSFDVEGVQEMDLPSLIQQGTWLLVLWCDTCNNPVPPFVGRIHVDD